MIELLGNPLPLINITPFQIIVAILIFIVGMFLKTFVVSHSKKAMLKSKVPEILADFLSRFLDILLIIAILLISVSIVGVQVGGIFIALSAVIGLVLGFGLQDTINNIASGFWIALLRPFDVGDVVETNGYTGKVNKIDIMTTELITPDNKLILLPNGDVWGSAVVNYTRLPIRRVDVDVGIAYGSNIDEAVQIAMDVMKNHSLVLGDPAPAVAITSLGDSSVNLQLRAWTKTEDYWTVMGDLTKQIYDTYNEKGIEIPFPQLDVHLKKE